MAFFEQIGKKLTDAGQNVAQQTKDLADVTKLNNAISNSEKKISQLFFMLGQAYYERHKTDDTAEEREKIEEINELYSEIIENREKIKMIKGVAKCENCGADVANNAVFCNVCGAKVTHTENKNTDQNTEGGRTCPVCHAAVAKGNLFCNHCGTKLEETNE